MHFPPLEPLPTQTRSSSRGDVAGRGGIARLSGFCPRPAAPLEVAWRALCSRPTSEQCRSGMSSADAGGGRCGRRPRGSLFAPRLADPFRSLLPHGDPFREPCQVGTRGDEQCGLNDHSGPVLGVGCWACTEEQPGLAGEQVRPSSRYLLELWGGSSRACRCSCRRSLRRRYSRGPSLTRQARRTGRSRSGRRSSCPRS